MFRPRSRGWRFHCQLKDFSSFGTIKKSINAYDTKGNVLERKRHQELRLATQIFTMSSSKVASRNANGEPIVRVVVPRFLNDNDDTVHWIHLTDSLPQFQFWCREATATYDPGALTNRIRINIFPTQDTVTYVLVSGTGPKQDSSGHTTHSCQALAHTVQRR